MHIPWPWWIQDEDEAKIYSMHAQRIGRKDVRAVLDWAQTREGGVDPAVINFALREMAAFLLLTYKKLRNGEAIPAGEIRSAAAASGRLQFALVYAMWKELGEERGMASPVAGPWELRPHIRDLLARSPRKRTIQWLLDRTWRIAAQRPKAVPAPAPMTPAGAATEIKSAAEGQPSVSAALGRDADAAPSPQQHLARADQPAEGAPPPTPAPSEPPIEPPPTDSEPALQVAGDPAPEAKQESAAQTAASGSDSQEPVNVYLGGSKEIPGDADNEPTPACSLAELLEQLEEFASLRGKEPAGLRKKVFASQLGISPKTLYRIQHKDHIPAKRTRLKMRNKIKAGFPNAPDLDRLLRVLNSA